MEASKLQLDLSKPEPQPEPQRECSGEPLMPGRGALLELATTPRERPPDTEADMDVGQWLASIGASEDVEDKFLAKEIDTLGELADTVRRR